MITKRISLSKTKVNNSGLHGYRFYLHVEENGKEISKSAHHELINDSENMEERLSGINNTLQEKWGIIYIPDDETKTLLEKFTSLFK